MKNEIKFFSLFILSTISEYQIDVSLGLNLKIQSGQLHLLEPFTVAKEGQIITPEQAKLMKHLSIESVEFKVSLQCLWSDDKFRVYEEED